jgi:DNA polymerase type B, organellar and viral
MNKLINKNIFIAIFLVIIISFHINYGTFNIESIIISSSLALKGKYEFRNKSYPVNDYPINKELFQEKLVQFIQEISLVKGINIAVLTQLKYETGGFVTLGNRQPITINTNDIIDIRSYASYLDAKYAIMEDWYRDISYNSIFFNYCIITEADSKVLIQRENIKELSKEELLNHDQVLNLPLNQIYKSWGSKVEIINTNTFKVTMEEKSMYIIVRTEDNITVLNIYNTENQLIGIFIDKNINSREFIRYTEGKEFYIKNGKVFFFYKTRFSTMKNISKFRPMKDIDLKLNTITLDTETYKDENGDLQMYCISYYDGDSYKSYHILDYNNIERMLKSVFSDLFRRKNTSKNIYIHNGSEFDLIFLLKHLANYDNIKIKPLIKDGKFINITIEYGPNYQYNIYIKDSFLLLPHSLSQLSKDFNCESVKDIFPHEFVSANNLNYKGEVPEIKFFKELSNEEYQEYKSRFTDNLWNLKKEAIKYCELDCKALFDVLINFNQEIYNLFEVNITESPTLPSLAFRIFRTHFMDKIKIPILKGLIFKDICNSYYGGHVDLYKPESIKGKNVYIYDVNGLYPSAMISNQFPTKLISYFIGDISIMTEFDKINPLKSSDTTGFFKVEVSAPSLLHPILPYRTDRTTVYGEGSWTAWYSTDEMINAMKFGYKFNILAGYIFKKESIFTKFVEILNGMKENSEKGSPKYLIAKLLLNSLYGRFGMSPILKSHLLVDTKLIPKLIEEKGIENIFENADLGKKSLITINEDFTDDIKINVAIASTVTANARIHMSIFKNNPELTGILYYTDTDSAIIEKQLPDYMVDSKALGKMKLEKVLTKFIGLGPKIYGGKTTEGLEFTKVKGLKVKISLNQLEILLDSESKLEPINQEKWFKDLTKAIISTRVDGYSLRATSFKRSIVLKKGRFFDTKNRIFLRGINKDN